MVQEARKHNSEEAENAVAQTTLINILRSIFSNVHDPKSWGNCAALYPHATTATEAKSASLETRWRLADRVATFVQVGGDPLAAVQLFENARDLAEVLGDLHPSTLTARANLANSYRSAGRTPEAIQLEERVLTDSEQILGDLHPSTLTARANLANSYRSAGRTPEAIQLLTTTINQARQLTYEHPHLQSWIEALKLWSAGGE
jgi:tetratricopeptide (TPR) repeat protein